jgi:hypothetical protein
VTPVASAEREIAAPAGTLFAYLADLEQHWQLADRFIEVVSLERPPPGGPARGGVVRMCGPLGLRRTARTQVADVHAPTRLSGTAQVGATVATVSWWLEPLGERTRVRLEATVVRASPLDRVLLALGGGRWLARRFRAILATLERRVAAVAATQSVSA